MRTLFVLLMVAALAACATPEAARSPAPAAEGAQTRSNAGTHLTDAATTPLSDLNLVRAEIPPILAAAHKAPYAIPPEQTCEAIGADVRTFDEVLGPDLDAPAATSTAGVAERGAGVVGDAAVGALRSAAEGVIPFRGWVRKLTGAESYAREVAGAIMAGTVRRAYLKGLGQLLGCQAPAAPRRG